MTHFFELTPERVLQAVDLSGHPTTGYFLQLNSYENRVFDVQLEGGERIIVKFYRPGRWSRDAILDEHDFLFELQQTGLEVVTPIEIKDTLRLPVHQTALTKKRSLSEFDGLFFGLFKKTAGRMPQEFLDSDLKSIGRQLALLHNVGSKRKARHRLTLNTHDYGDPALQTVLQWISPELKKRYEPAAGTILNFLDDSLNESQFIRIHGDCHKGNLLKADNKDGYNGFFFVDFDDFCNGPEAQDFWMLLGSGEDTGDSDQLNSLITGYSELRNFNEDWLELFEALRGLRLIHYSAWIARRWEDPSFPRLFPEFNSFNYWSEETEALEKIAWKI